MNKMVEKKKSKKVRRFENRLIQDAFRNCFRYHSNLQKAKKWLLYVKFVSISKL